MNVILEAIQFNHVPDSASVDAFNIRRNETEPVQLPEWRKGISVKPEDSPAAYARDEIAQNTITIKAKFTCSDKAVTSVWVRALDGHLNPIRSGKGGGFSRFALKLLRPFLRRALPVNVLGKVLMTEVPLKKGQSESVLCKLADVKISEAGVSVSDIIWRWQFSLNAHTWTDFATANPTRHRIYTVLKMPTLPWQPESTNSLNTQQPWTEVLDYACQWAASAPHIDPAATLVTHRVTDLGPSVIQYDNPKSGSTGFTFGDTFDCADFLLLLRGQKNKHGSTVNCDDCAAIVATFANILGCDLSEGEMVLDFPLNPHLRIGLTGQFMSNFSHHTVAWKGGCGEGDELFDACVQLDSDGSPADLPHPWFTPANMRFGRINEQLYRFRLTNDPSQCEPTPLTARRRRVAPIALKGDDDLDAIMAFLENAGATQSHATRVAVKFFVSRLFSREREPPPWQLVDFRFIVDTDSQFSIQSFWRQKNDADAALRIDAFATSSAKDVEQKLKHLLSRYELLDIVKQELHDFGDRVHAVSTNFVIVFTRGEFVFQLRNIGNRLVSCESFARFIDHLLISEWKAEAGGLPHRY